MITANKIKVEGNNIFIRTNPTIGIIALTSFVDTTVGEDASHIFTKKFRYSKNGIIFSDWFPLTTNNILSIQVSVSDTLIIELSYNKTQPAGSNNLDFTTAVIGTTNVANVNGYYFQNSIFKNYFNTDDLGVLNWQINVLDKLFKKGLLPSYIDRYDSFGSPDHFIQFWRSVTKFFAYYVVFARKFQNFNQSISLLSEYIEERGLKVSPLNTLTELNYLMGSYYHQIASRGTIQIIDKVSKGDAIDGELLRLVHYNPNADEFIFNLYKPEHFGWNLGNSSPLFRGLRINDNVNKFYEQQTEVSDISKYPITASASSVAVDSNHSTLSITNGGITSVLNAQSFSVDEFVNYELFFMVKATAGTVITVGFNAYNKSGVQVNLNSCDDGTDRSYYFKNQPLPRSDIYLAINLMLYNKLMPIGSGADNGLKIPKGVTHITPIITCSGGTMNLYNMRFNPVSTSYSRGFLDVKNFISIWIKNNNNEIDILGINQFIRKYLIPYNSHIAISQIYGGGDYIPNTLVSTGDFLSNDFNSTDFKTIGL